MLTRHIHRFYLYVLLLRFMDLEDPWHRIWNDCLTAIKGAGFYGAILATRAAHNMAFGPWNGATWFNMCVDAAKQYARTLDANEDAVLAANAADITKEKRDSGLGTSDEIEGKTAFDRYLGDADWLHVHGPKFCTCRWWSWMDVMQWWSDKWTQRKVVLIFIAIQMGWRKLHLKKANAARRACAGPGEAANEELPQMNTLPGQTSAKEEMEKMQKLWEVAKNTLAVVLHISSDRRVVERGRQIMYSCQHIRLWYGVQRTQMKTRAMVLLFYLALACGKGEGEAEPKSSHLSALSHTMAVYQDMAEIELSGFTVDALDQPFYRKMKQDDPCVDEEDEKAEALFKLRLGLIRQRVWSAMKYMWGLPHSAVLLLHPDDAVWRAQLDWMKQVDAAWLAAAPQTTTVWQQMKKRSCCNWTLVKDMMRELRAVQFESVPESLKTALRRLFSNTGSTVHTEELFQTVRDAERDTPSGEVTANHAYWIATQGELFQKRGYDFREVVPSTVHEDAPHTESLEKFGRAIHYPAYRKASLHKPAPGGSVSLRSLPGYGPPKWTTMNAHAGLGKPAEELKFLVGLGDNAGAAGRFWSAQLLPPGTLCRPTLSSNLSYIKHNEGWWWSLGCHTCAVALWPAQVANFGGKAVASSMVSDATGALVWTPQLGGFKQTHFRVRSWNVPPCLSLRALHFAVGTGVYPDRICPCPRCEGIWMHNPACNTAFSAQFSLFGGGPAACWTVADGWGKVAAQPLGNLPKPSLVPPILAPPSPPGGFCGPSALAQCHANAYTGCGQATRAGR